MTKKLHSAMQNFLRPLGFEKSVEAGEFVYARSAKGGSFVQEIVLNERRNGEFISVSITIAVTCKQVQEFVQVHGGEEIARVATASANLAQLLTRGASSGWDLQVGMRAQEESVKIAQQAATQGVAILERFSNLNSLADLCTQELNQPGSGEMGLRHVFELPAILYIAGRSEAFKQSVSAAERELSRHFNLEDLPTRLPDHFRFLARMRKLIAAAEND